MEEPSALCGAVEAASTVPSPGLQKLGKVLRIRDRRSWLSFSLSNTGVSDLCRGTYSVWCVYSNTQQIPYSWKFWREEYLADCSNIGIWRILLWRLGRPYTIIIFIVHRTKLEPADGEPNLDYFRSILSKFEAFMRTF